jgi:hypothetical protein
MMGNPYNKDAPSIAHLIAEGTVGAELGVWMGNSSKLFLDRGVKELHLVDSWSIEPYKDTTEFTWEEYLSRYSKVTGEFNPDGFQRFYDRVYQDVCNKFMNETNVRVHRMTTDEFFDKYKEPIFDWVYVDAAHSYEGVLSDLNNCLSIVKKGGMILGDDYKWGKIGKAGVTKAVNQFIEDHPELSLIKYGLNQFRIDVI